MKYKILPSPLASLGTSQHWKLRFQFVFVFLLLLTALSLGPLRADAISPEDVGLKEGDLISSFVYDKDPDIFIINEQGFKRLFLNQAIFKFYGHLKYISVKLVKPEVKDQFITSSFYRDCEDNDPKVYGLEATGEDTGALHHFDVDGNAAVSQDKDFFKKIFCINKNEFNWYQKKSAYSSLGEAHSYKRVPPSIAEHLSIDPSRAALKVGESVRVKAIFTPLRPGCLDATPPCLMPEQAPQEVDASFISDNPKIAAVDVAVMECPAPPPGVQSSCNGLPLYTVRGVSGGETTIIASYTNGEITYTARMHVTVGGEIPIPSIKILSPNGGEIYKAGDTINIHWSSSNYSADTVATSIRDANGNYAGLTCGALTPNTGSCFWAIPSTFNPGSYKIRVSASNVESDPSATDDSDAPFSIVGQTSGNLPPVISGLKSPTTLKIGETGTWTVQASDPENGSLTYGITWGDEDYLPYTKPVAPLSGTIKQTTTFTHVYTKAGTFTPTFEVTDQGGLSAKTSASVNVGESTPPGGNRFPQIHGIPAIPENIQPGQEVSFRWSATDADNDSLAWSVDWGDGTGIEAACVIPMSNQKASLTSFSEISPVPPITPVPPTYGWTFTQSHAWQKAGSYKVAAKVIDCKGGTDINTFMVNLGTSVPSVDVTLDTAAPISATIAPGQTNVPFAKIKLSAGDIDVKNLNAIQIASDSVNAGSNVINARVYDGATPVGSIVFTLTSNGSYYYGWANLSSPFVIPAHTSKVLTITGDVLAFASGSLRLGIAGLNFNSPGASTKGLPVYGSAVAITSTLPSATILSPNGGETWNIGSAYTIKYRLSDWTYSTTLIYLDQYHPVGSAKEGNINSSVLIAETKDQESFTYALTSYIQPGSAYKIKICNGGGCTVSDSSDTYFSIVS